MSDQWFSKQEDKSLSTRISGTIIMKEDKVARFCSSPSKSSFGTNAPSSSSIYNLDESSSDFAEDCGMTSGSRTSTLDRIYAREQKLYDEVKNQEYLLPLPEIHERMSRSRLEIRGPSTARCINEQNMNQLLNLLKLRGGVHMNVL